MAHRYSRRRRGGFTLMEVLLVLVILVILGSMAGVFIRGAQKTANANAAQAQIDLFKNAIEMYQLQMLSYPPTLEALREPTGDLVNWGGPYLDKPVPLDPWGNPYQYALMGPEEYRIWSWGPDGVDGSADDISNDF